MVRSLLFEAAKVLLGRSARPSVLKTWGKTIWQTHRGQEGNHSGRARKLSVILHRMWTSGTTFKWDAQVPSRPA
jgi:transposase